jgi:Nucleotide-diphospho-sugar transferase
MANVPTSPKSSNNKKKKKSAPSMLLLLLSSSSSQRHDRVSPRAGGWAAQAVLTHLLAAWVALQVGIWSSHVRGGASGSGSKGCHRRGSGDTNHGPVGNMIPSSGSGSGSGSSGGGSAARMRALAAAAAVDAADFLGAFASGFPWNAGDDQPLRGAAQVLLVGLGSSTSPSLSTSSPPSSTSPNIGRPRYYNRTSDALSALPCREVRQVVLRSAKPNARDAKSSRSCLVLHAAAASSGGDSYHIQKWMQHGGGGGRDSGGGGGGDSSHREAAGSGSIGWRAAGRYQFLQHGTNTLEDLPLSKKRDLTTIARDELRNYLTALHGERRGGVLERLQPVADRVAAAGASPKVRGTILVLTVNYGHADLFVNYVCAARAAGMDLSKILLVATDRPTFDLADQLGIAAFYDPDIFAIVPQAAAAAYGDGVYAKIMMSKAYCVHLLSLTGHHILFQDVDIIPYQPNYLEWWIDLAHGEGGNGGNGGGGDKYDLVFQSDFSSRIDYAPWYVACPPLLCRAWPQFQS